uniref:CD247 molecule n=1 Tax=Serinus canaria TaxID=9135 RepID=A0A8C9NFS0_SERCA
MFVSWESNKERKRMNNKGNPKHQYQEGKPQPSLGGCEGRGSRQVDSESPHRRTFWPGKMKWRRIAILATLQAQLPATDAASVLGLTDPRLCYVLDGFLFIYAVVMTALFVKAKLSQASEPQLRAGQDDVYNKLSRGHRDDYDVLGGKRGADPELGGRHQNKLSEQNPLRVKAGWTGMGRKSPESHSCAMEQMHKHIKGGGGCW